MKFVLDPDKNRGYPYLSELPDMNEILFRTKPYPESLMLKKADEYPYTPVLPRKIKTAVSRIVSGNFVKKIYFGRKAVKAVYINGECIFSKMELD